MTVLALAVLTLIATSVNAIAIHRPNARTIDVRVATIPSDWTKGSCIVDSTSSRALGAYHTSTSTNTPANCISTCASQGYLIAGVEYGQECWCGNSIAKSGSVGSTASSGDCDQPCTGDSTQTCGNGNRLQIYQQTPTVALPAGWTKSSCVVDSTSTRALGAYHTSSSTNTPAECIATCQSKGYLLAGLEYGQECWCGNSLTKSGSVGSTASDSDCDQPCSGDPTQTCGAGNRLQLYSDPPSNDPPPPSSTTSSTSTSKSTSTTTSTTRSSTTTSHTTTTTANSIPSDWSESSCLVDSSSARALGTYHTSTSTNTPATCINTCNSKGYDYAGLEYGEECWCGNVITVNGSVGTAASSSDCSQPCSGDSSQTCGNGNRLQLYHKAGPSSTKTAKQSSPSSGGATSQDYTGGVATFFYQKGNYGACGWKNPDSALIAAIDQARYGDSGKVSALCGRHVQITNNQNGKTVTVEIADDCPSCENSNSIDLSTGAFDKIASESTGVVPITWHFVD